MSFGQIILNNGYGQFHLARLAENLQGLDLLKEFYTGAYVGSTARARLKMLPRIAGATRLYERTIDVPVDRVHSYWAGELPHQVAQRLRSRGHNDVAEMFIKASLDGYARWASRAISRSTPGGIYHFRAGMGGKSVGMASSKGMKTLCDHSIAHPRLLQGLVDGTGSRAETLSALWSRVERDMERADGILVNSRFVAETCLEMGVPPSKLHVAYTGVDPTFLGIIDRTEAPDRFEAVKILFAGTLERRKGVDTYLEAARLSAPDTFDWRLVGTWTAEAEHLRSLVPGQMAQISKLPRAALAAALAQCSVFVFPSRAEGSARVVAEALAAGCYVVTTPQSGSIVRDGVDGRLVAPGDAQAILNAVREYSRFGPDERMSRSTATRAFARAQLNESAYTASVLSAYESVGTR
jgi:glycosyltransferase involved in cell wall biosynthesis